MKTFFFALFGFRESAEPLGHDGWTPGLDRRSSRPKAPAQTWPSAE